MSLLTITSNYNHITLIILSYLDYTTKRNLFFTNSKLQQTLIKYKTMKPFTDIIKHQTLTFYFPPTRYNKKGHPRRNKQQTYITTFVNAGATKITCQTCNKLFYNAKHERQIQTCDKHQKYQWHNNKMHIIKKGHDKLGNKHNSQRHFQPNGTTRQLILCHLCHNFLYYHTSTRTIKTLCAHCNLKQKNTPSTIRTIATETY